MEPESSFPWLRKPYIGVLSSDIFKGVLCWGIIRYTTFRRLVLFSSTFRKKGHRLSLRSVIIRSTVCLYLDNFNIILSFTFQFTKWPLSIRFSNRNSLWISLFLSISAAWSTCFNFPGLIFKTILGDEYRNISIIFFNWLLQSLSDPGLP